jgi:hypothetical protein
VAAFLRLGTNAISIRRLANQFAGATYAQKAFPMDRPKRALIAFILGVGAELLLFFLLAGMPSHNWVPSSSQMAYLLIHLPGWFATICLGFRDNVAASIICFLITGIVQFFIIAWFALTLLGWSQQRRSQAKEHNPHSRNGKGDNTDFEGVGKGK